MTKETVFRRLLAGHALVPHRSIQEGMLLRDDRAKLVTAIERLSETRLFIDDTASMMLEDIRLKSLRLKEQQGELDLIVIDYLQMMKGSAAEYGKSAEYRVQELSEISRGLKALAKELKVPVIALSQLSRSAERRDGDKKPLLGDLRDSGSIENDADVVCFVHREEFYDRENEDIKGRAEIIIAKQRNGPTGSVHLAWLADYTRFENIGG